MRTTDEYLLILPPSNGQFPTTLAEQVLQRVWRHDFTAPGFCLLDAGPSVDSHLLRWWMLALKEEMSAISTARGGPPFSYRSMARFDQQETTKFHLDGAPVESLLMLGYEPSRVRSRLFLADYSRCAYELGITPAAFLHDYNPMYRPGEELLPPHVTELPPPAVGHAQILLINNSSLPFTAAGTNSLGVLHRAEIGNPTETEQRIVNSIMLVTAAEAGAAEVTLEQEEDFVHTEKISPKIYR